MTKARALFAVGAAAFTVLIVQAPAAYADVAPSPSSLQTSTPYIIGAGVFVVILAVVLAMLILRANKRRQAEEAAANAAGFAQLQTEQPAAVAPEPGGPQTGDASEDAGTADAGTPAVPEADGASSEGTEDPS